MLFSVAGLWEWQLVSESLLWKKHQMHLLLDTTDWLDLTKSSHCCYITIIYIYLLLLSSMVCFFYFLHLCLSLLWFSSSRGTSCFHNAQLTIFAEQAAEMHCSVACNASPVLWTHGCWERLTCRYGCRQINRTTLVEYSLDVINPSALSMLGSEWQHTSRKTHMSLL